MPEPVPHFDGYDDAFGFLQSLFEILLIALSNIMLRQNVNAKSQESFIQFALCSEVLYG